MYIHKILGILFCVFSLTSVAQQTHPLYTQDLPAQRKWVDSIYNGMSEDERIGQLFMVDVFSRDPKSKTDKVKDLIKKYHVGGVIFSKGGPIRQARLNNDLQRAAKVPLLVGMDAEWGLAMRLDSTYAFPWNMTLGAIQDNRVVEKVGRQIGKHCKRLGVHFNFAPDVDININPANPIIGNRSFGEDRINVTEKAIALARGMQSEGVLGSAKHFPGHGDTDKDSHKTLPTLDFTRKRLDSIEMFPYKPIIDAGIASIMVAHLNVPKLVPEFGYPTSISPTVVTKILKDSLNFNGLTISDALNMKGASEFKEPGDIDVAAFVAGNDILLISSDVPAAHQKIKDALKDGVITTYRLETSVKKILYAKYKVGLQDYKPVVETNLVADLNTIKDDMVYSEAISKAITVVKNSRNTFPIQSLDDKKIAYVSLGDASGDAFLNQLNKYTQVDHIKADDLETLMQLLTPYNLVIIGFHRSNENPWKDYKFSTEEKKWLYEIAREKSVMLDLFVRPYAMLDVYTTANIDVIIHSYQNSTLAQEKSAQLIFGAIASRGLLPVSLGDGFPLGSGFQSGVYRRLSYGIPEEVGMNTEYLTTKIDSLVSVGLKGKMMPGAQVLVARRGKVIFEKSYGHHTYNNRIAVKNDDVYDIASMTKILGTLPLLMEQHGKGSLSVDEKMGDLIPELKGTNKANVTLKRALTHTGRFKPWIPFYMKTLDSVSKKPSKTYYRTKRENDFEIKITDKLYLRNDYNDSIIRFIGESDLRDRSNYRYSDLPYYLFKKYLEDYYQKPIERLTQERFYQHMGANHMGYFPRERFALSQIVPSENDEYWRNEIVQGTVHDMGAAMQGGAGGHAGLFSNANDVAKMMQMYLQNGYYGGKRYFGASTMATFNNCVYCDESVRRGIGFDKPQLSGGGPTCGCVSMKSFGHSGFTGTYTWADPEQDLVYVFLSNRTFPTMENRGLIKSSLRTIIQEEIYKAIIE